MKTLGKLKLLTVSALLVLGMSSCLKSSDPEFGISGVNAYVLQKNTITSTDTIPSFAPYILFVANEALASSTTVKSPSNPLGVNGKVKNGYYWESSISNYDYSNDLADDSYTINAVNAEGEVAVFTFQMGVDKDKAMGEVDADFSYDSTKGLKVKWKAAKNANYFELLAWLVDSPDNKLAVATQKSTSAESYEVDFTNYDASNKGFEAGKAYGFQLVSYYTENNRIKIKLVNNRTFTINSWGSNNN